MKRHMTIYQFGILCNIDLRLSQLQCARAIWSFLNNVFTIIMEEVKKCYL